MSGTALLWNQPENAVDQFNVYRAITGFTIPFPNSLQNGDVLLFSATSSMIQKITFPSVLIQDVIDTINSAAKGISAVASTVGPSSVIVRCTATDDPKLKIMSCTFATHLSLQAPLLIAPKQSFVQIGSVPYASLAISYEFDDADGDPTDWYYRKSLSGVVLSLPSAPTQATLSPQSVCVIEGQINDLRGLPLVGAEVEVSLQVTPAIVDSTSISPHRIFAQTDSNGSWSITVQRNQLVLFQIEAIGYNEVVIIPDAPAAFFKDLAPVDDHFFDASMGSVPSLQPDDADDDEVIF